MVLVDSLVLCSDAAELWIFLPAVARASLRVCPGKKHGGYMYMCMHMCMHMHMCMCMYYTSPEGW